MRKKEITFNCYRGFKCSKDKCKHNCCVGWQIDIDKNTLKKYRSFGGDFEKRLKSGVDFENARFKTIEINGEKRCAFLNSDNLCDIYINLGEKYLCKVCRTHPRFKNYFSDRIECGLGLSCEKGAEMLLCSDCEISPLLPESPVKISENENIPVFEKKMLSFRDGLISIVKSSDNIIKNIAELFFGYCGADKTAFFRYDYSRLFSRLEYFNGNRIKNFKCFAPLDKHINDITVKIIKRLLTYFLYRHIPRAIDGLDLKSRALFSLLSVLVIYSVSIDSGDTSVKGFIDVSREYSAEIEYSDENMNAILDVLDGFSL